MKTTLTFLAATILGIATLSAQNEILNVSYDPTRELYEEFNAAFAKNWAAQGHPKPAIRTSHGGSGSQATAVINGQQADVVTLALAYDIDILADKKLLPEDWQQKFPHNSSPYTSTIVFVVRQGNPKAIKDWADLIKPGIAVITPNPKTSGGARWNYLAAWAYGNKTFGNDEAKTKQYIASLFKNVPVLDKGARGSTNTFAQRSLGDVLLAWENEAFLLQKEFPGQFEIVVPTISMLAEPPVAVVDTVATKKGTGELAKAYLNYLYSKEGQEIAAKNFYRPTDPEVAAKYATKFPTLELVKIDAPQFGGWRKAQATHFNDGGIFDQLYQP